MKREKKGFEFALILKGVDDKTPNLEDSLFESGCDDALINFRNGTVFLDFDRKDFSLEQAVLKAIHDVESASVRAIVASVAPEDFVTESDISKRLNTNRQSVSLWTSGARRGVNPFPKAIMKLADRSPLWKWSEVIVWLYENKIIEDESQVNNAIFLSILNIALENRDEKINKLHQNILKKVGKIKNRKIINDKLKKTILKKPINPKEPFFKKVV